jgi:nitroreductase
MSNSADIFSKIPELSHHEDLRPVNPEIFDNILHNRRSVRVYTEERIPEELMQKVLDWALLAPNSSNLQCWDFYWVKEPSKKAELIKALFSQPAARTASELIVAVARLDTWKKTRGQMIELFNKDDKTPAAARAYYEKLVPVVYNQGPLGTFGLLKKIAIFFTGFFRVVPREPTSRSDMRVWAVKSTALACENIMLGFSAFGYDSCPMEGYDSKRVKKILGLGRNAEVVMVISSGKRDAKGVYGPRIRMPREQFVKIV